MAPVVQVTRPTPRQLQSGRYKLIEGKWHKLCTGPAHDEENGCYLPATNKYFIFRRSDTPISRCRLCQNWAKLKNPQRGSLHGWVPVASVRDFYIEAVNRVGVTELSRRSDVSVGHILRVLTDQKKQYVEKGTLRKIMLELVSMQRKNERSLSNNARWRTDRRNNGELGTCGGCGGPLRNITTGCKTCYDRYYSLFRKKKITKKEWAALKVRFSIATDTMIMGKVPRVPK